MKKWLLSAFAVENGNMQFRNSLPAIWLMCDVAIAAYWSGVHLLEQLTMNGEKDLKRSHI